MKTERKKRTANVSARSKLLSRLIAHRRLLELQRNKCNARLKRIKNKIRVKRIKSEAKVAK